MKNKNLQDCIDACIACAIACKQCANACLNEQDIKKLAYCIKLNHDCAAVCFLAIDTMASVSEFAQQVCYMCEEVCKACAAECEKHAHMQHCKECAKACTICAKMCREMGKIG